MTIHFQWINQNASPPDHQWVQVDASAIWSGNANSSGSVDDAFADPIVVSDFGENESGSHVIRKEVRNGYFEVSYSINAFVSCSGAGRINCGCNVAAAPTTRALDLDFAGALQHNRRQLDGTQVYFDPPTTVGSGWVLRNPPARFYYDHAVPVPVPLSDDDINVVRSIDFGLPAFDEQPSTWQGGPPPHELHLGLQGYATSEHAQPETYLYGGSNRIDIVGETLPTGLLGNGWDILPSEGTYYAPWYNQDLTPKKYTPQDAHLGEQATFDYSWADGCKGRAVLNVQFHPPCDNYQLQRVAVWKSPARPDVSTDWFDYSFLTGDYWSIVGAPSQDVFYSQEGVDLKTEKTGFELLVAFVKLGFDLSPEAEFVASLVEILLDIPEQQTTSFPLSRGKLLDADAVHHVYPNGLDGGKSWRELLNVPPGADPDDPYSDQWKWLYSKFHWHGQYAPDFNANYYVVDTWDSSGYLGQGIQDREWYDDMTEDHTRQYFFELNGWKQP